MASMSSDSGNATSSGSMSGKMRIEEVVIERAYEPAEILVKVIVLLIDAKDTSNILEMLCREASLGDYELLHLKRVRKMPTLPKGKVQIMLCPEHLYHSMVSQNELVRQLYESHQDGLEVVDVVKVAPQTKKEFQEWTKYWPMNFHPGELDRQRDKGISSEDMSSIETYVKAMIDDDIRVKRKLGFSESNASIIDRHSCGGLMVNTIDNKMVCTTSEAIDLLERVHTGYSFFQNPILTPTMLCIDHVAAIARGDSDGQDRLPLGHYLCTSFDLYLMEEPDLMSCMALVHSRIRRVFFIHPDPKEGALLSGNGHIHSLKALNHHYRVFRVYVDELADTS